MKLWLLSADYEIVVIRAETEAEARMIKKQQCVSVGLDGDWCLDPNWYACEEIPVDGEPGIVAELSG